MKQLTGVDLSFLLMETERNYGHVNGLSIYERPSDDFDPFVVVRERLGVMVSHLEPLRRKLVTVPFDLDRPYWIEDADFDLDYHVRHIGLAPPGATDQLAEQVARIVGRPMDRTRPLWEAYVIEGLADGRWALLQKTHHATIDGASGVIMLTMMTDESRDAEWNLQELPWSGEQPPPKSELFATAIKNLIANPVRGARLSLNMVREFADAAGITSVSTFADQARNALGSIRKSGDSDTSVSLPVTPAPATPWNKTVTPHRRFAMRSTSLANLKRLKEATGGTLNDVVMAICTGALREYLIEHDALPDSPLRAMVPVSIRTGKEENPWTNRVSAIVADLPTNCADPLERVALCRAAMNVAKSQFDLIPADTLGQVTDYASPIVAASAIRLVSSLRLADRVNSPINVVISNVPGPRHDLYFAGAKLDAYIPVSTVSDGVGLNITVHSYADRMDFGLISDRELVPDLWHLVDLHIAEIDRLFEATGAERAVPQTPPSMRYGGDGVEPVPANGEIVTKRPRSTRKDKPADTSPAATPADTTPAATPAKKKAAPKKVAKKTAAKKTAAKTTSAKKTSAKKASATKTSAKKASAKKATTTKPAPKKSVAKRSAPKEAEEETAAATAPAPQKSVAKKVDAPESAAEKSPTKKPAAKKAAAKKAVAKKPRAKKAAAKKTVAKKPPAKKAAAKETVAKKPPAKKAAAKKVAAKKVAAPEPAAKKSVAKKSVPKKAAAKKPAVKKAVTTEPAPKKSVAKKSSTTESAPKKDTAATKSSTKTSPAKKTGTAKKSAPKKAAAKQAAAERPATETEQPASVTEQPASVTEEPATVTEEPATATEQPSSETAQPSSETESPSSETEQPATATEQPSSETEQSATETEQPVSAMEQPSSETESPATETEQPSSEAEQPSSETEEPPSETEEPPSVSEDASSSAAQRAADKEVATEETAAAAAPPS